MSYLVKKLEDELAKIDEKIKVHGEWMERFRVIAAWDYYNQQREMWIHFHGRRRFVGKELVAARKKHGKN